MNTQKQRYQAMKQAIESNCHIIDKMLLENDQNETVQGILLDFLRSQGLIAEENHSWFSLGLGITLIDIETHYKSISDAYKLTQV